ncbi:MAG: aldo/keto reductase [Firmicutes bacterium]|nr:aldo/keto reductase [Bacillota bacterium]
MAEFFGRRAPELGFGLMRLPRDPETKKIDVVQVSKMVDAFLDAGLTYFDTAYVYEGSEEATREALVKRHPRNTYTLASKLNANAAKDEADAKNQIYVSLERTQAQYFDYYLLHALSENNIQKYYDYHLFDYVQELKAKGLVKHIGFSFHGSPALLQQILDEHPELEFVQLQLNYIDWENPKVASRQNYEIAVAHNMPIVVMEPVKGGTLAALPPEIDKIFKDAEPEMSTASWAIRYIASKPGIFTVLSGMSNMEQVENNLSYMADFKPLTEDEEQKVADVVNALNSVKTVPCTACHYCTEGCPMQIPIPDIFRVMNDYLVYQNLERAKNGYARIVSRGGGKASDCIDCGQCEDQCPQHIAIRDELKKAAELFED